MSFDISVDVLHRLPPASFDQHATDIRKSCAPALLIKHHEQRQVDTWRSSASLDGLAGDEPPSQRRSAPSTYSTSVTIETQASTHVEGLDRAMPMGRSKSGSAPRWPTLRQTISTPWASRSTGGGSFSMDGLTAPSTLYGPQERALRMNRQELADAGPIWPTTI